MRAYDLFADHPFWGTDGISPMDVRQGAIGNCWFMATASALAEKPNRLERVFLDKSGKMRESGIYGMNIYTLGVPHSVVIDDYLPLQKVATKDGIVYETLFSHVGEDQSMWGSLLEKAFAKVYGNYGHMRAGDPRDAARALNGSPSLLMAHAKSENGVDALWEKLLLHDKNNELMFLQTPGASDTFVNQCGLTNGHAYVVLSAVELSNGARVV